MQQREMEKKEKLRCIETKRRKRWVVSWFGRRVFRGSANLKHHKGWERNTRRLVFEIRSRMRLIGGVLLLLVIAGRTKHGRRLVSEHHVKFLPQADRLQFIHSLKQAGFIGYAGEPCGAWCSAQWKGRVVEARTPSWRRSGDRSGWVRSLWG